MAKTHPTSIHTTAKPVEKCILAGLALRGGSGQADPHRRDEECLAELAELARSAGAEVVDVLLQVRERPEPATLIGRGKVEEIRLAPRPGCTASILI